MDTKLQNSRVYSVYVGHLAADVGKEELLDLFKGYESLTDCYMKPKQDDLDCTWAFVRFKRKEDADKAIQYLNGWPVHGLKIKLDHSRDQTHKPRERSSRPKMLHDKQLSDHERIKMDALKEALLNWDENRPAGSKDPMELLQCVASLSPRLFPPYSDDRFGYKPIDLELLKTKQDVSP